MTPAKPITLLLAEDHAIVRQGLSAMLNAEKYFKIVGEAQTGREAVTLARTLQPDVILMDIAMPVLNGLEATRQILAAKPAARVLVLSAHGDEEYLERSRQAGAAGFLKKQTSAEILIRTICEVAKGRTFFTPPAARPPLDREGLPKAGGIRLTSREVEVLQLVAEGQANKQVASTLNISIKTVEKHRQHMMDKLNIHETAGLTRYAIAHGIVENSVQVTII